MCFIVHTLLISFRLHVQSLSVSCVTYAVCPLVIHQGTDFDSQMKYLRLCHMIININ